MDLKTLAKYIVTGLLFTLVSMAVQYVVSLFLYPFYLTAMSSGIGVTLVMVLVAILVSFTVLGWIVLWVAAYMAANWK